MTRDVLGRKVTLEARAWCSQLCLLLGTRASRPGELLTCPGPCSTPVGLTDSNKYSCQPLRGSEVRPSTRTSLGTKCGSSLVCGVSPSHQFLLASQGPLGPLPLPAPISSLFFRMFLLFWELPLPEPGAGLPPISLRVPWPAPQAHSDSSKMIPGRAAWLQGSRALQRSPY